MQHLRSLTFRGIRVVFVTLVVVLGGGLITVAAAQANSVKIEVTNAASHDLFRADAWLNDDSGWSYRGVGLPPERIPGGEVVQFTAFSPAAFAPLEGTASYRVGDTANIVTIYFDNPAIGHNTYSCTPVPLCKVTGSTSRINSNVSVMVRGE